MKFPLIHWLLFLVVGASSVSSFGMDDREENIVIENHASEQIESDSTFSLMLKGITERKKHDIECREKLERYVSTIFTTLQEVGWTGMLMHFYQTGVHTHTADFIAKSLLYCGCASGLTALLRWLNVNNYQNNPPPREYFDSYDALNLKKLKIAEISALLMAMIPLTVDAFGVSTGEFATVAIIAVLLAGADGYLIKKYFNESY